MELEQASVTQVLPILTCLGPDKRHLHQFVFFRGTINPIRKSESGCVTLVFFRIKEVCQFDHDVRTKVRQTPTLTRRRRAWGKPLTSGRVCSFPRILIQEDSRNQTSLQVHTSTFVRMIVTYCGHGTKH
jgi:hypothetical protein